MNYQRSPMLVRCGQRKSAGYIATAIYAALIVTLVVTFS